MNSAFGQEMPSAEASSVDVLQLEECRKLVRAGLATLRVLFRKLTGLESSVAWAPTWPHRWGEQDLPTGSQVCRRVTARSATALARCQDCGMKHLDLTLNSGQAGHHFRCPEGVRNFWFPIIVRRCAVGIAFVQALDGSAGRGVWRGRARRAGSARPCRAGRAPCLLRAGIQPMTRSQFKLAAELLQVIAQHAQTSALADLRKSELHRARLAVRELQSVLTRLREELNHVMPALRTTAPALQPESHSQQIVHALLDCIAEHYAEPLTLQQCGAKLGVSVSYLSHLFSCATGMPFKTYLTEVRIEKARERLSDPTWSIAQVADAVGYASENRFRIAFKKVTGLSPRMWRETLRMEAPSPSRAT